MAVVPEGGYQQRDVSEQVWDFAPEPSIAPIPAMIKLLESAWQAGGQAALWRAIESDV